MTWRAGLEAWAHRQWASRGPVAWLLSPLSLVFLAVSRSRRERTVPNRLPVPVVVVGNIYVGGTGKTPVTIALVRELQARGWRPGVISRGFGRREDGIRLINEETPAAEAGDEPLLIARETGVPVAVGRARFEAGRALLEAHPEVDLIVSDDGLQHAALARDVEIAVVGARGLGNGWVLPAGPLREPPSRLDTVDAIVLNTSNEAVAKIGLADDEIVVNLQGDEPLMPLNVIRDVADLLASRPDCAMATAAHTIHDVESFFNPNVVKVVLDDRGTALTFSRAPIPWPRDHFRETKESLPEGFAPLHHLGLYAYRAGFLRRFPTLPQAPLEKLESLEQLRALYYGERIAVMVLDAALPAGVDTQKDLNRVRAIFEKSAPV